MAQYPHQENMPYAKEPLKTLYVSQRLFTTLFLVPVWATYYVLLPRSSRPRESWSIKQIIAVNFTRRVYKVTELAGVTWGTRNPEKNCDNCSLKETRFEWVDPLPEELRTGIVVDEQVPFKRVGTFVWPKDKPPELDAGNEPVIGIFLHGGGYCHMSAHEQSKTSKIPRRLMKDKAFTEIHAVEYRLLQHAPFPAAVQDAAAVYAHILQQYHGSPDRSPIPSHTTSEAAATISNQTNNNSANYFLTPDYTKEQADNAKLKEEIRQRVADATRQKRCKIILIGDSAGGNLVLALARWIRDEGLLPPPDGLLLLSPSCDPSHAFPESPSSYTPRPHANTDYLVDTPEPRALLQRTFLGHNPLETMYSPYVSPASLRVLQAFYGDLFADSVQDLTIREMDTRVLDNIRNMVSAPSTPVLEHAPGSKNLERSPTSLARPIIASPRGMSLFTDFPKVCVVLGDAERLEREVMKLVSAMERDDVKVKTIWVEDGVHDVLMMGWWDEQVRDKVWDGVEEWVREAASD